MNTPNFQIQKRGTIAICQDVHTFDKNGMEHVEKKWLGIFVPPDSSPIHFGPELWGVLQNNFYQLDKFSTELLKCGHWTEYINGGLCPFCGKFGVGHPNVIDSSLLDLVRGNGPKSMAPDPLFARNTHLPPYPCVVSKNAEDDGLWIEWVYVIDPKTYSFEVLKSVRVKGFHDSKRGNKALRQENYQYVSTSHCCLFNDEPNWGIIEQRGINMSKYYFDKAHEDVTFADFGIRRIRRQRPEGEK